MRYGRVELRFYLQENEEGSTRVVDAGGAATCINNCRDCNVTVTGRAVKLVVGTTLFFFGHIKYYLFL